MKQLIGNAVVGQSGGPTAAINATLSGVIRGAKQSTCIKTLFGMRNGVEGLMREDLIDLTAYFDGEKLPEFLEIAPPLPGERMIPFGSRSEKKIKKLRTDRRIHAETPFPVLRGEGKVFWAVTVRHSALAQVTPGTRLIVKIEFEEILI